MLLNKHIYRFHLGVGFGKIGEFARRSARMYGYLQNGKLLTKCKQMYYYNRDNN